MKRAVSLIAVTLSLSACVGIGQRDFGCKNVPAGVNCASALEVYQATEYSDFLGTGKPEAVGLPTRPHGHLETQASGVVRQMEMQGPVPIRTPEKVIRIWVAPWEGRRGDLRMPNYVFAEVEDRRWVVGEKSSSTNPRLTPLEIRTREKAENGPRKELNEVTPTLKPKGENPK